MNQMNPRHIHIAALIGRLALFIVYFWFGALKILGISPAGPMVADLLGRTMPFWSFDSFIIFFAAFEMLIGILFLIPRLEKVAFGLFIAHMITTSMPLFLLPLMTWQGFLSPTLEGQYIIKNVVLVALAFFVYVVNEHAPTHKHPGAHDSSIHISKNIVLFSVALFFTLALSGPQHALADEPTLRYFNIDSTNLNSHQYASFSWSTENGGGNSLIIPCAAGVKFKYTDGTTFACDSHVPVLVNDGLSLSVINVSGGTQTLTARLIPKDGGSTEYPDKTRTVTFSISPSDPINSFTVSANTSTSGQPVTFTWDTVDIEGGNIIIDCVDGVRATAPAYPQLGVLSCGQYAFPAALVAPGSVQLLFTNSNRDKSVVNVSFTPSMDASSYNGTRRRSIALDVVSDMSADPTASSFSVPKEIFENKATIPLSWVTKNDSGVNFTIRCGERVTLSVPCTSPALTSALRDASTFAMNATNTGEVSQRVEVTLLLARKDGTYVGSGKTIAFNVLPTGAQPSVSYVPNVQTNTPVVAGSSFVFTKYIAYGSRNADVTALQNYLKKFPSLYPEASVSGFYGRATEKAVQRFQEMYGISRAGGLGYGMVGVKTREKLNQLAR